MSAARYTREQMPAEAYHDAPALSAGGIHTLMTKCPAIFWHGSPLNPAFEPVHKREFDIGTAVHLAVLEPDEMDAAIVLVEADDWKKKDAQAARAAAYAADKVPLLTKDVTKVRAMRAAIFADPVARNVFVGGEAEASLFWDVLDADVRGKIRIDCLRSPSLIDLKTSTTANPRDLERIAFNMGWHTRAAWYLDGYRAVTGETAKDYWFAVVEKEPPHLVTLNRLEEDAIDWGRKINRKAVELFGRCRDANDWHNYRDPGKPFDDTAHLIRLPNWAHYQMQDRDERGEFETHRPDPKLFAAQIRARQPHATGDDEWAF